MGSGPGGRGGSGARRGGVTGNEAAAEAYQRLFQIVKQTGPGGRTGFLTGDKDIVHACDAKTGKKLARGLAKAASRPVADNGTADLLGGGETEADEVARQAATARLNHYEATALGVTLCNIKEFTSNAQAFDKQRRWVAGRRAYALRRFRPLARREARIF
jgi:hypothetical protein